MAATTARKDCAAHDETFKDVSWLAAKVAMTDEDPPISAEELAELHRVRVGKPPDYAMPKDCYRNPEACAKYLREKIDAERKARWKDED